MKKEAPLTHLFIDIGGVLLTNGWDHHSRNEAMAHFQLDGEAVEQRHRMVFESFEIGKFSLDEYLSLVIFTQKRSFTRAQFKRFMFAQSKPYPKMLALARTLKEKHGLKIVVVSNEARELNAYRIQKYKLDEFVDTFVSSCFVQLRKPDPEIFRLALDISQARPEQTLFIDNTALFVEIAEGLGIRSILHTDYSSTCLKLDFKE